MRANAQDGVEGLKTVTSHDEEIKMNGLAAHTETFQTPEEVKAEKRYVLKIDVMILQLLVLSVFLSSLVRTVLHLSDSGNSDHAVTQCLGSW